MVTYVVLIIVIALVSGFSNGLADADNPIARVPGSRVHSARSAPPTACFLKLTARFAALVRSMFRPSGGLAIGVSRALVCPQSACFAEPLHQEALEDAICRR